MSTATLDGSRALYGIARDGMTIKQLAYLNKHNVPERGMLVDAVLNIFLVVYFGTAIEILAAGNLGYMLAHVFALSGFLLLRRDRPGWPRPIRLPGVWVPIAAFLAIANLAFIVLGGFVWADKYGYGLSKTLIGVIVLARLAAAVRLPARSSRTTCRCTSARTRRRCRRRRQVRGDRAQLIDGRVPRASRMPVTTASVLRTLRS